MKLSQLVIHGFRSIKGTERLALDERTTVLIGANDHGKSNILAALTCLNDEVLIAEDDRNWDLLDAESPRIEWHFRVSKDELANLYKEPAAESTDAGELFETNQSDNIVFVRDGIGGQLAVASMPYDTPKTLEPAILSLRPKVELFSAASDNLRDSTSLDELQSDLVMQGLFRLAGIWDTRDTIFVRTPVTSKRLSTASEVLTKALREQWHQGSELEWRLVHNGDRIEIEIGDPSISTRYSKPSLRSSGFRTYFLLSMITMARTADNPDRPYFFVFDEPGTYLHPRAQIDLQRSLEKIANRSQIVYSTHSLFLINKNHPRRNKVVAKTVDGTRIDQKPFNRNWKSVRESLGILFSNNFLIAEKTLLVEGPSDVIYILDAVKRLKARGKTDIDLNDFSIVDAGTKENYVAMGKLMLAEGRAVVALVDGDAGGTSLSEGLGKACDKEIKDHRLTILRLPESTSAEDVFANIEVLRDAAKEVAQDVVEMGVRSWAEPKIVLDDAVKLIATRNGETLGWILDQTTKGWFTSGEKLSKLSIALKYEDLAAPRDIGLHVKSDELIKKFQKLLNIRGEMSAEEGIFEQVS